MTLTLTGAIDATQNNVQLSGDLDAQPGDLFRLDDELVEFGSYLAVDRQHAVSRSLCSFGRGVDGTTAASHTAGTELLGAVEAVESGTTSVIPAPFPSGGGGGITMTESDTDPGAIGAGNFWLQTDPDDNFRTLQLWVRNADDDGWLQASLGSSYTGPGGDSGLWDQATGSQKSGFSFSGATAQMQAWSDPTDVSTRVFLSLGSTIGGERLAIGSMSVYRLAGTADPSAGAGIAADIASTYQRNNAGTGELWVKTGAADTAWNKVTTS